MANARNAIMMHSEPESTLTVTREAPREAPRSSALKALRSLWHSYLAHRKKSVERDIRGPHYFASIFIKILPYGWDGPTAPKEVSTGSKLFAEKRSSKRISKLAVGHVGCITVLCWVLLGKYAQSQPLRCPIRTTIRVLAKP